MATTIVPKRSSRLKLHEPSTKITSKKKPQSKKVITNKDSRTGNINTRSRSSRVSMENKSLQNNQTSVRCLRPRRNNKNYCEDSKLLQQYISPKQQDSVVKLEKINLNEKKKVPVYKALKSEKSLEDNDVYDFKFDINDSKEKIIKKGRKRNVTQRKGKVIKKTMRKKVTVQLKTIDHETLKAKLNANPSVEIVQKESSLESIVAIESTKEDVKKVETSKADVDIQTTEKSVNKDVEMEITAPIIDTDIQTIQESTNKDIEKTEISRLNIDIPSIEEMTLLLPDRTFAKQINKENVKKPRIISIENADNIIITKSPPKNTENSQLFRPKNIFDNKISVKESNRTLKYSLLAKTLSPIPSMKTNTLDLGSPWRVPTLMFSRTKHFIQSTPHKNFEANKENKEINRKSMEMNRDNTEMDKEINRKSMEMNKENMEMNKESAKMDKKNIKIDKENIKIDKENIKKGNKGRKERKQKALFYKKHATQKKLSMLENQAPEKIAIASKLDVKPAPARISLGEIKNLLEPNINEDNKLTNDQVSAEVDKSFLEQKNKQFINYLNFSDTFDLMSETERLSNIGEDAPLFMDLEPSHFSKPPRHSYKRKRIVKFDFSEDSEEEEKEKENVKPRTKKKKPTKSEKEQEKRINEWIKTVNTTFQEIEEHDLIIE
ncbi:FK506-binding protein 5-like [Pogonomyrmex barbatus]|uniref:FK506-binding protein 5-like n=1 Tax=Pogonomyrmex barbatus TaxID=144034 RepID=A0A6I9X0K5_9HYME|nr:FK506-binding protein 5-like [Pogonomyrmex barbatus]XP_011646067.1 FK506-binding protein 5-like [Pogonomyrmex barbatus]